MRHEEVGVTFIFRPDVAGLLIGANVWRLWTAACASGVLVGMIGLFFLVVAVGEFIEKTQ